MSTSQNCIMGLFNSLADAVGDTSPYTPVEVTDDIVSRFQSAAEDDTTDLIQVRPSADGPGIEYAEDVMSSFYDNVRRGTLLETLGLRDSPEEFSFEIWFDSDEKLKFLFGMPTEFYYDELRTIITGEYPSVGVKRYNSEFPDITAGDYISGAKLRFESNKFLPIKGTRGPDAWEAEEDPYRLITSELTGQANSRAVMQVVFTPAGTNWRQAQFGTRSAGKLARHLREGRAQMDYIDPHIEEPTATDRARADFLEASEGSQAFYVTIRYFTIAPHSEQAKKYASSIGNGLASTYYNDVVNQGFSEQPLTKRALVDEIEDAIARSWDGNRMTMLPGELGAIAHLPNDDISTPNVDYTRLNLGSRAPSDAARKVKAVDPLPYEIWGTEATEDNLTPTHPQLPEGRDNSQANGRADSNADTEPVAALDGETVDGDTAQATEGTGERPLAEDGTDPTSQTGRLASLRSRLSRLSIRGPSTTESAADATDTTDTAQTGTDEATAGADADTTDNATLYAETSRQEIQSDDHRDAFTTLVSRYQSGDLDEATLKEEYNENSAENLLSLIKEELQERREADATTTGSRDVASPNALPKPAEEPTGYDFEPREVIREWSLDPHTGEDRAYEVKVKAQNGDVYMGRDVRNELIDIHEEHPESPIWLGYLNDNRVGFREIGMEPQSWFRHLTMFGMTGMGKSTFQTTIMNQIVRKGDDIGLCYIDPKGDTVEELVAQLPESRRDDVIWIEPGSDRVEKHDRVVGLNFLEASAEPGKQAFDHEVTSIVSDLTQILKAGDYWGPKMEGVTTNLARAMIRSEKPFTLLDMYYVLQDDDSRQNFADMVKKEGDRAEKGNGDQQLVENMRNIHTYTQQIAEMDYEEVDAVVRRIQHWVESPIARDIVAHREGTVNLTEAVENGKIILVKIDVDNDDMKQVVSTAIMRRVWAAIKARDEAEQERTPFFTFIDEFDKVASTEMNIEDMLARARSGKMGVGLSTQNPSQLAEEIRDQMFSNSRTMSSFGVGEPKDANLISTRYGTDVESEDIMEIPQFTNYTRVLLSTEQGPKLSEPLPLNSFADYPPLRTTEEKEDLIAESLDQYGVPPITSALEETNMLLYDMANSQYVTRTLLQSIWHLMIRRQTPLVSLRGVDTEFEKRTGKSIEDYPMGIQLESRLFSFFRLEPNEIREPTVTKGDEPVTPPEDLPHSATSSTADTGGDESEPDSDPSAAETADGDDTDAPDDSDATDERVDNTPDLSQKGNVTAEIDRIDVSGLRAPSEEAALAQRIPDKYVSMTEDCNPQEDVLIDSLRGVVGITQEGIDEIMTSDDARAQPSGHHRQMLRRGWEWTAIAGFKSRILPQAGADTIADGSATLPIATDWDSAAEADAALHILRDEYPLAYDISSGRDLAIEAETRAAKPARVLGNLRSAYNSGEKCLFLTPDGDVVDRNTYTIAKRVHRYLTEPTLVKDTFGEEEDRFAKTRVLYNTKDFLPLSDDPGEEKFALINKGNQCIWHEREGELFLMNGDDSAASNVGKISPDELSNASANPFEYWGRYDDYEKEYVVYPGSREIRYDTIAELEQDWQRVYKPFHPESEFDTLPDEDDWEILFLPGADDPDSITDIMPQMYSETDGEPDLEPFVPPEHMDWENQLLELLYGGDPLREYHTEADESPETGKQINESQEKGTTSGTDPDSWQSDFADLAETGDTVHSGGADVASDIVSYNTAEDSDKTPTQPQTTGTAPEESTDSQTADEGSETDSDSDTETETDSSLWNALPSEKQDTDPGTGADSDD